MQQALEEVEDRLSQLKDETREEKLARLEQRFNEMLERQRIASVMTIEIDDKRNSLAALQRRDQLLMLRIANDEIEISEIAQQAYDLLLEDGTSIVFPEAVQDLREDLAVAAARLNDEKTGAFTQLIQKEIEHQSKTSSMHLKKLKRKTMTEAVAVEAVEAAVINVC